MTFENSYFIVGPAYAGKSTMIRLLAVKYNVILCEENYHYKFFWISTGILFHVCVIPRIWQLA